MMRTEPMVFRCPGCLLERTNLAALKTDVRAVPYVADRPCDRCSAERPMRIEHVGNEIILVADDIEIIEVLDESPAIARTVTPREEDTVRKLVEVERRVAAVVANRKEREK